MTTIREVIVDSGRWDAIVEIIGEMLKLSAVTYPVDMQYEEDGETVTSYVVQKDVRKGISHWLMLIDNNMEEFARDEYGKHEMDFSIMRSFSRFVDSELNTKLHNIAVDLIHGKDVPKYKLENIRALSVLNSSIDYIVCGLYLDIDGDFIPFSIPSGWKKGGD